MTQLRGNSGVGFSLWHNLWIFELEPAQMWAMIVSEVEQSGSEWVFPLDFQGKNSRKRRLCLTFFFLPGTWGTCLANREAARPVRRHELRVQARQGTLCFAEIIRPRWTRRAG